MSVTPDPGVAAAKSGPFWARAAASAFRATKIAGIMGYLQEKKAFFLLAQKNFFTMQGQNGCFGRAGPGVSSS